MLKIYPSWFMFFLITMLGVFFVLSSNNWFMVWMGFELTLLGFLPMFLTSSLTVESMIKYFLIQVAASTLFIFSFMVNKENLNYSVLTMSMLLKMGMFPFFQWVPTVMASLSWTGCLMLVTIQKLGPLFMMMKMSETATPMLLMASSASVLISGLLGYNQSNMRPLMGYSSISHSGWMVSVAPLKPSLMISYLMMYFFINVMLFLSFEMLNNQKLVASQSSPKEMMKMNIMIMSLAGIPPFSIFFMKMMILQTLMNYPIILMSMILGACLSIYFYMTFIIPNLMKLWHTHKMTKSGPSFIFMLIMTLSLSALIM